MTGNWRYRTYTQFVLPPPGSLRFSMASPQPTLRIGPFLLTACSARLVESRNVEDWVGPLQFALWCQRASPWWIGDLLNAGDAEFGESFSQACEGKISGEMLQRYESVARRVPPENRRPDLSWSSHVMVARLTSADQRKMLHLAEENGWSSEELRRHVRQFLAAKGP